MTGNPTVKVVFAGDSASLEAANRRVVASTESVSHKLKDTSAQAKYMKTTLNGAGDAAALFGGQLGQTAITVGYSLAAVKDLTKGLGGLSKTLGDTVGSMSAAKFGLGTLTVVLLGAYAAWELGTAAGNKLNDMLGRTPSLAQASAAQIRQNTAEMLGYATAANIAGNAARQAVAAQSAISYHNQNGTLNDSTGFMQGPVPLDAGGRIVNSTNGGNSFAAAAAAAVAKAKASAGAAGTARSIQSSADKVAEAAKAAAAKLKAARNSVAQAVGGIVSALSGHLESGDPGNGLMIKSLGSGSNTLLDKLRKQAQDTARLASDLQKLSKMKLDKGLLSDLVSGGLGSLGAADELLAGGKGAVGQANKYATSINASGTAIASAEVSRNLSKKDRVQIDINVNGAESDLKKMFRKWLRTDGANSFGLAAA